MIFVKHLIVIAACIIILVKGQAICPPGEDFWPVEEDCNSYYICDAGDEPLLANCPPELYWNQDSLTCDYPENVPECQGGTRPPSGSTTTTATTTTTTTTTIVPPTDGPTTEESPETEGTVQTGETEITTTTTSTTTTTTEATITSTRPPLPDECPATGSVNLPYPGDCSLYTWCNNGFPLIMRCPEGQKFDSIDNICKNEGEAVCSSKFYF